MTTKRDVIHKLVLARPGGEAFEVDASSTLVSVGPDPATRAPAVWFRRKAPLPAKDWNRPTTTWLLGFAGTGEPFPADATLLGTVLTGAFAFHVLDLDGQVQR